jgi:hypothetical protein
MAQPQDIDVQLELPSGERGQARLAVSAITTADHWSRAYRPALQLFGAGAVLALVPLMHLLGPLVLWSTAGVLLYSRLHQKSRVLAAQLTCPKCAGRVDIADQVEHWPIETACDGCRWQVRVSRLAPLPPGRGETGASAQPL